jgi:hypothetical protein
MQPPLHRLWPAHVTSMFPLPEWCATSAISPAQLETAAHLSQAVATLRTEYWAWQHLDDLQWHTTHLPHRLVYTSLFSDAPQWSGYALTQELTFIRKRSAALTVEEARRRHARARAYLFICIIDDVLDTISTQQGIARAEAEQQYAALTTVLGGETMRRWLLREVLDVMRTSSPYTMRFPSRQARSRTFRMKLLWQMFRRGQWSIEE